VAVVKPFRALRYGERAIPPTTAPPYDVISPEERGRYLEASPHNIVHLTLPESEEDAGKLLVEWQTEGVLEREREPALWWLRQEYVGPDGVERTRDGLVAALRAEPYAAGVVLPHERTHAGPKEGRLRLLRATRTHLEPIFVLYDGALDAPTDGPPVLAAEESGVRNSLWQIEGAAADALVAALADAQLVIADGHHRYETALAFQAEDGHPGSAFLLAVVVPTRQAGLTIFATHRVVGRLPELDGDLRITPVSGGPEEALRLLDGLTRDHPAFVLYRDGSASLVEALDDRGLDAALVDRLGPSDVSYTPRVEEAVARVDAGEAQGALLLRPTQVEQVEAVARAGETMPQKSTYFYPKLASGLLLLPID
jgi:uncharacterized protein (DUF1015 family)